MRKYIVQLLLFSVPLFSIMMISEFIINYMLELNFARAALGFVPMFAIKFIAVFSFEGQMLSLATYELIHLALKLIIFPYLSVGLFILVANLSKGKSMTMVEILRAAAPVWKYYLLLSIAMLLFIVLGLAILIIPGIWLFIRLILAQPILIFEGKVPVDAMALSFRRTSAVMSKLIFLIMPLIILVAIGYGYIYSLAGFRIEQNVPLPPPYFETSILLLMNLVVYVLWVFSIIMQYRLYQVYGQAEGPKV